MPANLLHPSYELKVNMPLLKIHNQQILSYSSPSNALDIKHVYFISLIIQRTVNHAANISAPFQKPLSPHVLTPLINHDSRLGSTQHHLPNFSTRETRSKHVWKKCDVQQLIAMNHVCVGSSRYVQAPWKTGSRDSTMLRSR